jgi:hypothetical protein
MAEEIKTMFANLPENFKTDYLAAADDINLVTKFWNTYNNKPLEKIQVGQLSTCKTIDPNAFTKIHKGHPFYFIGITSFLMEDFQTAVYFFDASMTEDINAGADPKDRAKPSTRFLMMEGEINGHTAQPLAAVAKAQVQRAITYYLGCTTTSGQTLKLDIEEVRNNFVYRSIATKDRPGWRTVATAFISYFIEWDFRNRHFEYGVKQGTSEPFFSHLFRGCVLFESLLKHNPSIPIRENTLNGMLNQKDVRAVLNTNPIQGKGGGSAFTLEDVFDELKKSTHTIDEALKVTYSARNTLGHNLGWDSSINQEQYQRLYFSIAASCLHVIACLWK